MQMKFAIVSAIIMASVGVTSAASAAGDAAAGQKVFYKCAICHTSVAGKNGLGPSLFGVVGRHSASAPGYNYSDAMKAANKTWDEKTLDVWLTNPKALVPGTKMAFSGLPKAEDRENVIAYLATLK